MPDRPPEFAEIDIDDEDQDEEAPPSAPPEDDEDEAEPIDIDDDEDEDNDADEDAGANGDNGEGAAPRVAAREPESDSPDFDEEDEVDGVQRAAAVLKYIVEHIVDEPSEISIGATSDDRGPVLLLRVAEDDRGKIIGRQGRIVQAIRTVVKAATVGTGERVSVEVID